MDSKINSNQVKVIRSYYGFQLFFNLILWVPVFYAIQKSTGLSDGQIFGIQSIYYIGFVFFEIPTGYLADRLGYRMSMRIGAAALVAANLLPVLSATYMGFLSHFLMIAVSRSLISGAASAYLYDFLKDRGETKTYKEIEGKARSMGLIGKVICWSGVGYLMQVYLMLPYLMSAITALIALGFSLILPDLKSNISSESSGKQLVMVSMWKNFGSSFAGIFKDRLLFLLMLQGIGLFVLARINQVNMFQPILGSKEIDVQMFGWVMSGMTLFEAFGSSKSRYIGKYLADIPAVFVLTVIIALSFIGTAVSGQVGTIVAFCVFSLASGLAFPIQRQLLNDAIKNSSRATVLSIESVLNRSVSAVAVLPLGGMVAAGQLDQILFGAAGITIFGVSIVFILIQTLIKQNLSSKTEICKERIS